MLVSVASKRFTWGWYKAKKEGASSAAGATARLGGGPYNCFAATAEAWVARRNGPPGGRALQLLRGYGGVGGDVVAGVG
jgi:hypothetical protein